MKSESNEDHRIRVLAVCAFPVEAAATRFRLKQFVEPLRKRNIDLTIRPFLTSEQFKTLYEGGNVLAKLFGMSRSVFKRVRETFSIRRYDVVLIQREAMLFGPGIFEWIYANVGRRPTVLDLDDATYVRYVSPTYGKIGSALKFFGKTDNIIRRSSAVLCGNSFIADHVAEIGGRKPVVVPTIVDQEIFAPKDSHGSRVTMGWIGTHSTFPFLAKLLPVIDRLSSSFDFDLKIVGGGDQPTTSNTKVDLLEWDLEREPEDFRSLDIGLYPIFPEGAANDEWLKGKSGFKAIQYMACGVPFVMSPVGVCAQLGEPGITHFNAESEEDWYNSLSKLLAEPTLRSTMGRSARKYSLEHFGLEQQANKIAEVLVSVSQR